MKRVRAFSFYEAPAGPCERGPERAEECTCAGCKPVVAPIVMAESDSVEMAIEIVAMEGRLR